MVSPQEIIANPSLIWSGHFETASGLHTNVYWKKFELLGNPALLSQACTPICEEFRPEHPETVVGPTLGGVFMAYEIARQLDAKALAAERVDATGQRGFRGSSANIAGVRVLIVDDVLMTGGTLRSLLTAVERAGALVMGIGLLLDRGTASPPANYKTHIVHQMQMPEYELDSCPLCRSGEALTVVAGQS